jgi:hypothetical protein
VNEREREGEARTSAYAAFSRSARSRSFAAWAMYGYGANKMSITCMQGRKILTSFSDSSISFHFAPKSLPRSAVKGILSSADPFLVDTVKAIGSPNFASGFSSLMRSRQSWLKNMYALSGRLGAFLSLGARFGFDLAAPFSAALRCRTVTSASQSEK